MTPRSERLLDAIAAVAEAANRATSAEDAFRTALTEILETTGWSAGHVYVAAPADPTKLEDIGTWEPRGAAGRELDVGVVHSVPVAVGAETVAVLEFFGDERASPVADLAEALGAIGVVLGRVVERARAEDTLQRARRDFDTRIEELASHGSARSAGDTIRDGETGLFTQRFLEEALLIETSRAGRARAQVAVIGLAIDGMEELHRAGDREAADARIQAAGDFLLQNVRKGDIPARAGDDFVIVLAGIGSGMGRARAQQLQKGLSGVRIDSADPKGRLSVSAGLASFPQNGAKPETLIEAALGAARQAQSEGGNRVLLARPSTERWSEQTGSAARTARSRP